MEKEVSDFKLSKKFFNVGVSVAYIILWVSFIVFFMLGSASGLILLAKLYPDIAIKFLPQLEAVELLMKIGFKIFLWVIVITLIILVVELMIAVDKKRKQRFIQTAEETVEKITQEVKNRVIKELKNGRRK